jgi:hypothetical protein
MPKFMTNIFNEYNLKARVFPALLTAIPLFLIKHYIINQYFSFSLTQVIFGDVSILVILVYLFSQINRVISKGLFEVKSDFPTDKALLPSSSALSPQYRKNLSEKIKSDFNLTLPELREENENEQEVKVRIREIVKSIISKVKDGRLLLQHNIEYGFYRNLLGGSVVASLVSFVNIFLFCFIFQNNIIVVTSVILFLVYMLVVIFHKKILKHYSEEYTQVLFREYLETN